MKMASRVIDLISKKKKNKLHVQHTFSTISTKTKFARAARFALHDNNAVLYD